MIPYSQWLHEEAAESDHPLVRDSERILQSFFELEGELPPAYGWKVTTAQALGELAKGARSFEELNRMYWHDIARQIEGYGILTLWRASELFRTTLQALNEKKVLPPAVLGRSALELAASFLYNANKVLKIVEKTTTSKANLMISEDLERLLLLLVHGTRIGDPPDFLKQKSASLYVKELSKNPNASELYPVYSYLCELAHPNVVGHSRFFAGIEKKNRDGSEVWRLEREAESATAKEIREKTLWAIGWSGASLQSGFVLAQENVQAILKRWPV